MLILNNNSMTRSNHTIIRLTVYLAQVTKYRYKVLKGDI